MAEIENKIGIQASYYFRTVKESNDPKNIKNIVQLGHEVGYHYEDVDLAKGNIQKAIELFKTHLEQLRGYYPVKTICMHGNPTSKWDSRLLWKYYDYRDFGITGEPYFDIDFSKVLYLTDTGRRWDGEGVSVRDRVKDLTAENAKGPQRTQREEEFMNNWKIQPKLNSAMRMSPEATQFQKQYNFRSTFDIIRAAEEGKLPDKIMMTFHPQRWTDKPLPWLKELIWQNVKNVGKYWIVKIRKE